jgi:tRNA-2-methylthio-N6-dimethylallyladenosine synthase
MTQKVFIKTFGCQMNEYDSAKMADVLRVHEGLEQTDRLEDADVVLFNTCSVREKAQEKVFSDLGRVREMRAAKPHLLIGVGGCVASQEGAALIKRAPYVDLVFGPQTLHRLPQMRRVASRRFISRDREVRSSAAATQGRPVGLHFDHGRLLKILQLLRGSLHPRRRGVASL